MKEQGYDEDYCNICLTHSYLNNDVICTGGGLQSENSFREEFIKNHEYNIYEKIISIINDYDTIIIMGHKDPDLDSLGSSLGLYEIVESLKKDAFLFYV